MVQRPGVRIGCFRSFPDFVAHKLLDSSVARKEPVDCSGKGRRPSGPTAYMVRAWPSEGPPRTTHDTEGFSRYHRTSAPSRRMRAQAFCSVFVTGLPTTRGQLPVIGQGNGDSPPDSSTKFPGYHRYQFLFFVWMAFTHLPCFRLNGTPTQPRHSSPSAVQRSNDSHRVCLTDVLQTCFS